MNFLLPVTPAVLAELKVNVSSLRIKLGNWDNGRGLGTADNQTESDLDFQMNKS